MEAAKIVESPLAGKTLEVKDGKVAGAAKPTKTGNVVSLNPPNAKKPPAKKPSAAAPKGKKITLLAKECPARKGSARAKLWAKLKTGMTLTAAKEASIPLRFLKKMQKKGHLKIGA